MSEQFPISTKNPFIKESPDAELFESWQKQASDPLTKATKLEEMCVAFLLVLDEESGVMWEEKEIPQDPKIAKTILAKIAMNPNASARTIVSAAVLSGYAEAFQNPTLALYMLDDVNIVWKLFNNATYDYLTSSLEPFFLSPHLDPSWIRYFFERVTAAPEEETINRAYVDLLIRNVRCPIDIVAHARRAVEDYLNNVEVKNKSERDNRKACLAGYISRGDADEQLRTRSVEKMGRDAFDSCEIPSILEKMPLKSFTATLLHSSVVGCVNWIHRKENGCLSMERVLGELLDKVRGNLDSDRVIITDSDIQNELNFLHAKIFESGKTCIEKLTQCLEKDAQAMREFSFEISSKYPTSLFIRFPDVQDPSRIRVYEVKFSYYSRGFPLTSFLDFSQGSLRLVQLKETLISEIEEYAEE